MAAQQQQRASRTVPRPPAYFTPFAHATRAGSASPAAASAMVTPLKGRRRPAAPLPPSPSSSTSSSSSGSDTDGTGTETTETDSDSDVSVSSSSSQSSPPILLPSPSASSAMTPASARDLSSASHKSEVLYPAIASSAQPAHSTSKRRCCPSGSATKQEPQQLKQEQDRRAPPQSSQRKLSDHTSASSSPSSRTKTSYPRTTLEAAPASPSQHKSGSNKSMSPPPAPQKDCTSEPPQSEVKRKKKHKNTTSSTNSTPSIKPAADQPAGSEQRTKSRCGSSSPSVVPKGSKSLSRRDHTKKSSSPPSPPSRQQVNEVPPLPPSSESSSSSSSSSSQHSSKHRRKTTSSSSSGTSSSLQVLPPAPALTRVLPDEQDAATSSDAVNVDTLSNSLTTKLWIERYYANLFQELHDSADRRNNLEQQMHRKHVPKQDRTQLRKQLADQETIYCRFKRAKMSERDFTVINQIGKGAYGEVLLAKWNVTGELVAMKKLSKRKMIQKTQGAHIRAERDVLAAAHDNPWVVKLLYAFQDSDYLYLITEFLPGGDMMSLLIKQDIFTEDQARFYCAELILAVESVHKLNYIHRDVKPDNLIFDRDGHLKLIDFGLCTGFQRTHATEFYETILQDAKKRKVKSITGAQPERLHHSQVMAKSTVGTPDYTCPEVVNETGYGAECDFWSIGCVMFEMLTGYPPFAADTVEQTCENITNWVNVFGFPSERQYSPEAKDFITKLLCDREHRLGFQRGTSELKEHPFFASIAWDNFRAVHKPPFVPVLANAHDLSNFDRVEDNGEETDDDDPTVDPTTERTQGLAFIGYTFRRWDKLPTPGTSLHKRPNLREVLSPAPTT
eukprot:TRINITY_DN2405_c0_g1_i2.p1 TRINITY_DN2405_c0_g1~~TRINITY_DN2405_c0_g1_i2.p1  ORF type:complete len:967 (-),score=177.35 TRINITY_DN2405_c0_g1_i2:81-2609(-)